MEAVLSVDHVTKQYGSKVALKDFSMEIHPGEIVALIGENGAGKTTLLNLICGFIRPSAGVIRFQGERVGDGGNLEKLGILIEPSFFDYLTAEENLQYLSQLAGKGRMNGEIANLLKKTELYKSRKKKVKTFSFGMKQRLGLCQSLLADEELLIFDEPFVGLDPIGKELFKKVIVDKAHKDRVPVLFSSHDLDDVDEICDRVVMIRHGKQVLNQFLEREKTIVLQIDGGISASGQRKLEAVNPAIRCEENYVYFRNETLMIDIQKILLEEGHYIAGVSIQNNNLKKLFLEEDAP